MLTRTLLTANAKSGNERRFRIGKGGFTFKSAINSVSARVGLLPEESKMRRAFPDGVEDADFVPDSLVWRDAQN